MQINAVLHLAVAALALASWCQCAADEAVPHSSERLLSRRRRYLIFPEGSSFQLIYDQIIPIVDYTNLFIFGVTTAIAWPLPTEPIDKAKLRELYANATLPDIRRADPVIPTASAAPNDADNFVYNTNDAYYRAPISSSAYDERPYKTAANKKANAIYGKNDVYYKNPVDYYQPKKSYGGSSKFGHYFKTNDPNARLYNQIDRNGRRDFRPWQTTSDWGRSYTAAAAARPPSQRRHTIYPMIGRRSVRDLSTNHDVEDRLSLHHHRTTRHALYENIEQYLQAHGQNGTECVRKVLCETAQKRSDSRPGSFVGELLRVVFSLPDLSGEPPVSGDGRQRRRRDYDDAYHGGHDCDRQYPLCPGSVWGSFYTT